MTTAQTYGEHLRHLHSQTLVTGHLNVLISFAKVLNKKWHKRNKCTDRHLDLQSKKLIKIK